MSVKELEQQAIERLKCFEPQAEQEPYYIAYSGGKDSDTVRILAELAGVRYEVHHNLTTVDAPETVYYIRSIPNVIIHKPEKTMWQLIPEKLMPPTRFMRYCCAELKERNGQGRRVVTGVRQSESPRRKKNIGMINIVNKLKTIQKKAEELGVDFSVTSQQGIVLNNDNTESRELVEHCSMQAKVLVNPIYDWTDADVWEFLRYYGCKSNPLYECGFERIGCIGCPMARQSKRYLEFRRYPKYKQNYIRAFERMIKTRKERGLKGKKSWETGEEVFAWWMNEDPNQLTFDGIFDLKED